MTHVDGNAVIGALSVALGADMADAAAVCENCGLRHAIAECQVDGPGVASGIAGPLNQPVNSIQHIARVIERGGSVADRCSDHLGNVTGQISEPRLGVSEISGLRFAERNDGHDRAVDTAHVRHTSNERFGLGFGLE
jgi:hypothetical protein